MKTHLVVALLLLVACKQPVVPPPVPEPDPEPMPQTATYTARGLYTYPNPFSEIPDGAFSRADDVVIRREGFVETRRGFRTSSGTFGTSLSRLRTLSNYTNTLVGHTSDDKVVRYDGAAWSEYNGTYAPPTGRRMRFVNSAKSLYFTTSTGVKRVDETTGAVYAAGVPQAASGTVASTVGAHAVGSVLLVGGAGDPTITINGTGVTVPFNASDAQTALDQAAAMNANATVSAVVTAVAAGTTINLTAVNGGTGGNAITLTATRTAGAAIASGSFLTGGTNVGSAILPTDSQTAYRFVWGFRNANDRVILGAPSGRMPLINPETETPAAITVTVFIPSWVTTENFLQVYRADASGGDDIPAGDDMGLVYEVYPSAQQIADGSLTFEDVTPDELKGAPLYSSPNAGVPGSEKFQPPVCTDLAEYKGRVWCSTTTQRQRLLLTLLSVDATSGGMQDGDQLIISGPHPDVTITAGVAEDAGTATFKRFTDGTVSQNVANTSQSLLRVLNAVTTFYAGFYVSGEFDSPGQMLIEATTLGDMQFFVQGGNGGAYWTPAMSYLLTSTDMSRAVDGVTVTVTTTLAHGLRVGQDVDLFSAPTPDFPGGRKTVSATPTSTTFQYIEAGAVVSTTIDSAWTTATPPLGSDPTDAPNGLAYAEYGEGADAVPLGSYLSAGSANYAIQRIITLGDTLFIFKEEATYILTGDTPETFSIRQFPTPAKLLAPESAVVLGNAIYALMDQGVMVFTESGAQVISRPIEGDLLPLYSGDSAMLATLKDVAFGVSYETEREYHLFVPTLVGLTAATRAYVYNYATRAWTVWLKPVTTGFVLPGSDLEYLGNASSNSAFVERKTRTNADYQDETGIPILSVVEWQVRTGGDPGAYKQWQKVTAMVEAGGPTSLTLYVDTELSATSSQGTFPMDGLPYITTYIPVEQQRSQVLTVGVAGGQAQKRMAISGLNVDFFSSSTKLR